MKKILIEITAFLLCAVFALSACTSQSGGDESKRSTLDMNTSAKSEETPSSRESASEGESVPGTTAPGTSGGSEKSDETSEANETAKAADPVTVEAEDIDTEGLFEIIDGVKVVELFSYSGAYVEDGSNEKVKDIAAVKIINTSADAYQLLDFELETAAGAYSFRVTTLFPGARLTALDLNRKKFEGSRITGGKAVLNVKFDSLPSVRTDILEISYTDGFINARNISDKDLNDVYVYYKTMDDFGYFGGITYRAFMDGIDVGKIVQTATKNITADSSRVVFVTTAE